MLKIDSQGGVQYVVDFLDEGSIASRTARREGARELNHERLSRTKIDTSRLALAENRFFVCPLAPKGDA